MVSVDGGRFNRFRLRAIDPVSAVQDRQALREVIWMTRADGDRTEHAATNRDEPRSRLNPTDLIGRAPRIERSVNCWSAHERPAIAFACIDLSRARCHPDGYDDHWSWSMTRRAANLGTSDVTSNVCRHCEAPLSAELLSSDQPLNCPHCGESNDIVIITQSAASGDMNRERGWGIKPAIFGGVVAAAVGILWLAVLFTMRWWSGDPLLSGNRINLAYLPEDTKYVHYIRLADAVGLPENKKRLMPIIEPLQVWSGFLAEDIESILLAYRDKDAFKVYDLGPGALFETDVGWLCVTRTNRSYSEKRIRDWLGAHDEETHAGEKLYQFGSNYGLYLADSKTIVFGTRAEVRLAVERGGREYRLEAFDVLTDDEFFSQALALDATGADANRQFRVTRDAGGIGIGNSASYDGDRDIYRERIEFSSVAATKVHLNAPYLADEIADARAWREGTVFVLENAGWIYSLAENASMFLPASTWQMATDPAYYVIRVADGSAEGDRSWALGRLGSGEIFVHERRRAEILPMLISLSTTSEVRLRHPAIGALATVGGEEVLPHLFKCLSRPNDRRLVIYALHSLGGSIEAELIEGLKSGDVNVRDVSRGMLAELASEETLAELSTSHAAGRLGTNRAYLPADTKAVHYIRVADAVAHAPPDTVSNAANRALMLVAEERTGIRMSSIESVTIGYPERATKALGASNYWTMIDRGQQLDFIAVVRLNTTVDKNKILQIVNDPAPVSLNGIQYFPVRSSHAVFFPDPRTIVAGTIEEVKAAITEDGPRPLELLDAIDPDDHVTFIFADEPPPVSVTVSVNAAEIKSYAFAIRHRGGKPENKQRFEYTTHKAAWMQAASSWQLGDETVEYAIDGKIAVYRHKHVGSSTAHVPTYRLLRWAAHGR